MSLFERAAPAEAPEARAGAALTGGLKRRAALLTACACAAALATVLAEPGRAAASDPDLATLVRGMAVIKTAIVAAVGAAIWWRLGFAIKPGVAAGYILFAAAASAGAALVWNNAALWLAPFLFDGGLLGFLIVALRDDGGPWLAAFRRGAGR
jgi:hypothetical protein